MGRIRKVLDHLRLADGGLSDGQLLGRFLDSREEAAFAALVRRHGPMVLGVCRRLLGNVHDAEDAFQATFLLLARKAASVVQREAVGSWLYSVAYRTAVEARAAANRRRGRERQVVDMPHPEVAPAEAQDWRPLLDRELNQLPEKYRDPLVLCDLQGNSRKQAARALGLLEGTLASRLATARRMLARRLARYGISLSGGALAVAVGQGASAAVSAALVSVTVEAAVVVAAGHAVAVATPAAILMNEVLKAMLVKKLKFVVSGLMVAVMLGAGGLVYRAAGQSEGQQPGRPRSEVETLRRELELVKFNLEVVLEKCRAQEAELRTMRSQAALRGQAAAAVGYAVPSDTVWRGIADGWVADGISWQLASPNEGVRWLVHSKDTKAKSPPTPEQQVDAAIEAFRNAKDNEAKQLAAKVLEDALKKLQRQAKPAEGSNNPGK
jgi:RNA polymerase sigma factor (sigma-70 family)